MTDPTARTPDVDALEATVRNGLYNIVPSSVLAEAHAALSDLAATARQGIEDSERFHRHVETMIEPKVLEEADRLARRVAELEAALRDAGIVIERMANGASRKGCSPEIERVIAALRAIGKAT